MELKDGHFHLIRFIPDIVRNEPINVGMILYEAEGEHPKVAVRMTRDWSRLLFLCPTADIPYLEAMESEIASGLTSRFEIDIAISHFKSQWTSPLEVLDGAGSTESRGVQFYDFDQEVDHLMQMYVDRPPVIGSEQ